MSLTLRGVRLVDAAMERMESSITIDGAHIRAIGVPDDATDYIDAHDLIVMPGFVEVHTHGGGGFSLHTTQVGEIEAYARWAVTTGVTSFLIGVVGIPDAFPEPQLRTAVAAIERQGSQGGQACAEALGIHMEGPYLNEKRRGAHPPNWLRLPTDEETDALLACTQSYLRLITLAPELPGAQNLIRRLSAAGVTVSIGHTDADYEQTRTVLELGITHATHCFNAMRPLLHREPGPLAAIAQASQVRGEVIADGVHVHPAMVEMLVRLLGPERVIVITDAQAPAGMTEGLFEFAGQTVRIHCGAARLADDTLAGSVLTMDQALRNILEYGRVSLPQAVGMLTHNPALSAGVAERKGRLCPGYDADLLLFDTALRLQATICRGKVAFAVPEWRERLGLG